MKSALIGCGRIAQVHARVLQGMKEHQVIACVDPVPERARELAALFGARVYTDYLQMLDAEKPEVVHLCTPHYLHVDMAVAALVRGIHVFMEKPAAISPASFQRLIAAQEASKAAIGVCFQNRYNATVRLLKARLDEGRLGGILGARCFVTWMRGEDYYADEWHGRLALEGGGVLINQAIHSMDLLVHLIGKPTEVQAAMHNRHLQGRIEVEDTLEAHIAFGSRPALFYASLAYCMDAPVMLELACERAICLIQGDRLRIQYLDGQAEEAVDEQLIEGGQAYWGASHKLCIGDFYQSIRDGRLFGINPRDIADTMGLVFACYSAAGSGQAIQLT